MGETPLEMLISALEQADVEGMLASMHLEADSVLIHQTDHEDEREITVAGHRMRIYETAERGVGRSRNSALEHSSRELVLFSDEDIVYDRGYGGRICRAFEKCFDADILLFNVRVNEARRTYWTDKAHRVHQWNCGRYPAYAIAGRRESLVKAGVRFSLLFGGGAPHSNGEDSLFLMDCLRKGLKIIALPVVIGEEQERESTWFHGYNEKFFYDRGYLYHYLYRGWAKLYATQFILRKKGFMCKDVPAKRAFQLMLQGIREAAEECSE